MQRGQNSIIGNWWWTVDKVTVFLVFTLIALGFVFITSASPPVAERIGLDSFFFVKKHIIYASLSIIVIFIVSLLNKQQIKNFSLVGLLLTSLLLIAVLFAGEEIKGSRRWINLLSFSLQPSEFAKPFIAVVNGLILSKYANYKDIKSFKFSFALYAVISSLVILQPDIGMMITITAICGAQIFLAGIPMFFAFLVLILFIFGLIGAYMFFPHVAKRIDGFLNPELTDNFQVNRSILALSKGGIFGKGPGEGVIKNTIPDSHADFIFAVIGEELGLIFCIFVIFIFATIVIRGYVKIIRENDLFTIYSLAGLLMQIALQSIVNIGVSIKLMPAKGMTLPFLSYGGSSMIAISITVGIILSLTRKKFGMLKNKVVDL